MNSSIESLLTNKGFELQVYEDDSGDEINYYCKGTSAGWLEFDTRSSTLYIGYPSYEYPAPYDGIDSDPPYRVVITTDSELKLLLECLIS